MIFIRNPQISFHFRATWKDGAQVQIHFVPKKTRYKSIHWYHGVDLRVDGDGDDEGQVII